MRDRLIELIKSKSCQFYECSDNRCEECEHIALFNDDIEKMADFILADGWMRPPCKVGDKVYKVICTNRGNCCGVADFTCEECPYQNREVVEGDVIAIKFVKGVRLKVRFDNFTDYYCEDEIYYAKEEAEQALKGGGQE